MQNSTLYDAIISRQPVSHTHITLDARVCVCLCACMRACQRNQLDIEGAENSGIARGGHGGPHFW